MRVRELKPLNRTGIARDRQLADELAEGRLERSPTKGSAGSISAMRIAYAKVAEPPGSMAPPLPDAPRTASRGPSLLLVDKLGERLAFERAGVRLYEALLSKHDAYGSWDGGPTRAELEEIRDEELSHVMLLKELLTGLGADPTVVTPSANLHGVIASGLPKALTDPRTDLQECLEAILVAELIDNDCWENLSDLALAVGHEELVDRFAHALAEERDHLRHVRTWLGASLNRVVPGVMAEPFEARAALREALLGEMLYSEGSASLERGSRH